MSTAHTMFAAILALCALTGAATPARERVIDGNGIVDPDEYLVAAPGSQAADLGD